MRIVPEGLELEGHEQAAMKRTLPKRVRDWKEKVWETVGLQEVGGYTPHLTVWSSIVVYTLGGVLALCVGVLLFIITNAQDILVLRYDEAGVMGGLSSEARSKLLLAEGMRRARVMRAWR